MMAMPKQVAVEATIWNKHGDHLAVQPYGYSMIMSSAKWKVCDDCLHRMGDHGMLHQRKVCPGDYIIQKISKQPYSITPKEFNARYELCETRSIA